MGGNSDKAVGRVKKAAGDLTGDRQLKSEGKKQETAGAVKNAGKKVRDRAHHVAEKIKD
ncbi:MAG: CsbD family protein [Candidatus Dormibacteraeota bacterium]|uniref:CsbD family protein n=1 Tax=Candidatus Aeolococcus gillhamiae TaxID=3127015 RepID=A0A2W6AE29_9BACT|nr:CsbD family protein [Candidatus Dormibacteraeota bacterium]PZR83498.1 MAG: CsbD family protein [Candidatus Dormibacter sp. RRmetagenome_bin12]